MAQDYPEMQSGPLLSAPIGQISGSAIKEVADLARKAAANAGFLEIPSEALPGSALLGKPHLTVIIGADGKPELRSLKSDIDAYRTKPAFREGTATALTLGSLIELVNRHANHDTAIFVDANWKAPKMLAVIDYHAQAGSMVGADSEPRTRQSSTDGEDELARFGRHRIAYEFPLSEAWKVWVAGNGNYMTQGDFAEFLEDHVHELAAPILSLPDEADLEQRFKTKIAHPSDVMDLARGLDVKVGASVKNRVKLQSGETQFVFETEHRDSEGRELTVPGLFLLSIPIFYRGEQVRMPVRLRYRLQGGAILWAYQLHRPDEAVDAMVRGDVDLVARDTGLPVYDGFPETGAR
ncbi:DUF2303 family protein [Methylobacterium sp. CM6244]